MIYFASDFHLGLSNHESSLVRERRIVKWLDEIKQDASDVFFVGDIFEFWFEWKAFIPKYFVRFFGKLAELSDLGINLHFFTGNHDIWAFGYFEQELGMKVYHKPQIFKFNNKKFYIAHGDGLGPGDKMYKLMKKTFNSKFYYWFFSRFLHPNAIFRLAKRISVKREKICKNLEFKGEKEWLVQHSKEVLLNNNFDFFVYGHRHIPVEYIIDKSKLIILGDCITNFTYAKFNGKELVIKKMN